MQASTPISNSDIFANFDSGDPDHKFFYDIQPSKDAEITGGGLTYNSTRVFALNNTSPVLIKPGSDNYTMSSKVDLSGYAGRMANLGSAVSASFTYNITYQ
ncbi:TPA: hypothetical protein G8C29_004908 [Salmonella enterica]|uniref:Fimbrial protein n=1 Tax=Salmonella enterica TaxID=28901 RepID=A0A749C0N0_SALER|nr:hypothetical protein [Salmonella enterica]EEM7558647.1 hypothetical protein [Salmonella enterica subsp. enterica serovar Infantis]HAF5507213.1 hypothetical protein [Salmonella enterica]